MAKKPRWWGLGPPLIVWGTSARGQRVRHFIEQWRAGQPTEISPNDDRQYLVDLGLLRRVPAGGLGVASPI